MKLILKTYTERVRAMLRTGALRGGDVSPKRDWYLLLLFTVALFVLCMGVGVYVYGVNGRTSSEESEGGNKNTTSSDIDTFTQVLGAYRERVAHFTALRTTPETVPYPHEDMVSAEAPPLSATSTQKVEEKATGAQKVEVQS